MAVLAGLEPTTRCLEGSCSVQMSYRTKFVILYHIRPPSDAYGRELIQAQA